MNLGVFWAGFGTVLLKEFIEDLGFVLAFEMDFEGSEGTPDVIMIHDPFFARVNWSYFALNFLFWGIFWEFVV